MGSDIPDETAEETIQLARESVESIISNGRRLKPGCMDDFFYQRKGVLLKLTSAVGRESVRGSAASYKRDRHLAEAIVDAALKATESSRGRSEVQSCEIDTVTITLCVIDDIEQITQDPVNEITLGKHGLIVEGNGGTAWMFPNIPLEYEWSEAEYLDRICCKAGYSKGDWSTNNVTLFTYEGTILKENQPGGDVRRVELIKKA